MQLLPVHTIEPEQINNTNSAGDTFDDSFVAGIIVGKDLKEAIHMGQ